MSAGAEVAIQAVTGDFHTVVVTGEGDTLVFSQLAAEDRAVLYLPQTTVNALAGTSGVNSIELTVDDALRVESITEAVRSKLIEIDAQIVFTELPDVREAGTWPGQDDFDNLSTLFYVGAVLALISSMVLISNTMTTMVAEQVREVAVMKAIGGGRRRITRSFLSTVMILGLIGAIAGIAIGIPSSNLLVGFIGTQFFGVDPAWGISVPVIVVSLVVGVFGSALATGPALCRASRISVRDGFDKARGLDQSTRLDGLLRRVPRVPYNARVGLRNVTRRRGRSLGTMLQIGLAVGTARGTADLEVVGIDGRLMNNGTTIYLPLSTFQALLARSDTVTLWVRSTSQAESDIDRIAGTAETELAAAGYPVRTEIHYVERDANLAANRVLVGVLAVMGVPIVAIGTIGLVNLMTMNVIERTREIGILRCIGARARDIRRIFRTEALAIALVGWVLSVPLGWFIGRTLVWVVTELFNFGSVPFTFPLWYVPAALVATMAIAGLVVVAPVRRAARLKPGDALRYE